jgi:hypothetical protein
MCQYKASTSLLILAFCAASYITIILPVALTGFEYWSFIFRAKKHNLNVSKNKVLRQMGGPKTKEQRKMHKTSFMILPCATFYSGE